jgi:hypothetical protein
MSLLRLPIVLLNQNKKTGMMASVSTFRVLLTQFPIQFPIQSQF